MLNFSSMEELTGRLRDVFLLLLLIVCAIFLGIRLSYWYLSDPQRFPVNTIKIIANYQHIPRDQLESILSNYRDDSFFSISIERLKGNLKQLPWTDSVQIDRVWPDTLKIVLKEKQPVAIWNNELMTADGNIFNPGDENTDLALPQLTGPVQQQREVLQNFQKLSKLLSTYGLSAKSLQLRDNQAWELALNNGVQLRLGKRDLEKRILRFCKVYPLVFADKQDQLLSVDLRYARGMAVQWKEPSYQSWNHHG